MFVSRIFKLGLAAAVFVACPAGVVVADHHEKDEKKPDQQQQPATTQKSQPIDFRKLKDVMPAALGGQKRTNVEGERTAVAEFRVSQARATYGDSDAENAVQIDVEVADYVAMPDFQGLAFWADQEIDQEGDHGFTRTLKLKDQPALEQYDADGKTGTLQSLVAKRYFITVNAQNISADDFKKLAEQLPVQKLVELKE